jgi:peptidoglycan hydrolase CwlO-like protein
MTQVFIQVALSVTGAVITIVGLLLVAGIIGYVTAWYYAKSKYVPVIKGLEKDKENLISQVNGLQRDIAGLNSEISRCKTAIDEQAGKIVLLEKTIEEKNAEIKKISKIGRET